MKATFYKQKTRVSIMSEETSAIISDFISIDGNEKLTKALQFFKEQKRELLVFEEDDVFLGYLTKRHITLQSRIQPDCLLDHHRL